MLNKDKSIDQIILNLLDSDIDIWEDNKFFEGILKKPSHCTML